MKQVRYYLQVKRKENPDEEWAWMRRNDIYDGWFWGDDTTPGEGLKGQFDEIVENEPHLDHRLVSEVRTLNTRIVR